MTDTTNYKTRITEQDKIIFHELHQLLGDYNDEQKKDHDVKFVNHCSLAF